MGVPQYPQQTVAQQKAKAADRNWRPICTALVQRPAGGAGQHNVQQSGGVVQLGIVGGHSAGETAGRSRHAVRCGVGGGGVR